jgi:hypothetical protein
VTGNVLRNDFGASAIVRHTNPSNGTATVNADGSFTYTPITGFHGTDTFTHTATDAVQLFKDAAANGSALPTLGDVAGPGRDDYPYLRGGLRLLTCTGAGPPGLLLRTHRPWPKRGRARRQQVRTFAQLRTADRGVQAGQRAHSWSRRSP